jgi:plastocyanin
MSKDLLSLAFTVILAVACTGGEPEPPPEAPAPQGVYGSAPAAVGGTASVVSLRAAGGAGPATSGRAERDEQPRMDQLGLVFTPPTLIARVGEPVLFTNSETLVHNVRLAFTDTDSTVFDVETDPGAHAEFVFDRPGGYDVSCDHHPGMRAFVFVTEADRTVFADNAGGFLIPDVAPGAYTLSVWSVDARLRRQREVVVAAPSTEIILDRP